jgi:hypothetical protein
MSSGGPRHAGKDARDDTMSKTAKMNIEHWKPGRSNYWPELHNKGPDQWIESQVFTPYGQVRVWSQSDLTHLSLYIHPRLYSTYLGRGHALRTFPKLAREFAAACARLAAGGDA